MSATRPLVSIVLPTYNRPEMVGEAVESVASQRYSNVELIVVDDGSSTDTEAQVANAAPDGLDWRCLQHEINKGANAARNTGISAATGEIIAFLDDDDRWKPGKLEAQVSMFQHEDVGVVVVGQEIVTEDGETTGTRLPEIDGDATDALLGKQVAGPFSTIAVRRTAVEKAGLPDERFPCWQDREWLLRLSRHCRFGAIRRPLVVRRSGSYEQIGDAFEPMRDVSYPLFIEKHRALAAAHGRERFFLAQLATSIAAAGLIHGYHDDARQFATRAIRTNPTVRNAYIYLALAIGGSRAVDSVSRLKRTVDRTRRSIPAPLS